MVTTAKVRKNRYVYAIRLSEEVQARLKEIAISRGAKPTSFARLIIEDYLKTIAA